MVAPGVGVGVPVAAGVGVGVSVAVGVGVGVSSRADGDVAGVTAELPAAYLAQPLSATMLTMTAATIRARTFVKR